MTCMYKLDSFLWLWSLTGTEYTIGLSLPAECLHGLQRVPRPLLFLWYTQPQFNGWNGSETFPVEPIFTLCEEKPQSLSKKKKGKKSVVWWWVNMWGQHENKFVTLCSRWQGFHIVMSGCDVGLSWNRWIHQTNREWWGILSLRKYVATHSRQACWCLLRQSLRKLFRTITAVMLS